MGSGEPEEDEQALWLEQVMAEAGERRIAWFLHRPLFLEDPGEGDTGYWSVKPQPRGALSRQRSSVASRQTSGRRVRLHRQIVREMEFRVAAEHVVDIDQAPSIRAAR